MPSPFSGRRGHGPAVGDDVGARDERGVVGGQEEGAPRDVLGLADAAEGDAVALLRGLLDPVDDVSGQTRSDRARADGVDADPVAAIDAAMARVSESTAPFEAA